jgi:hypothetical protein
MRDIYLLIIMLLAVICIAGYVWYFIDSVLNSLPGRVGYVGSSVKACGPALLAVIKKYIPDTSKVDLVEPGAGLSHPARFLAQEYTWKSVTAIDLSAILLLLARILDSGKGVHITYVWRNVFNVTYPKNSCVYCYLRTPILDKLYADGLLKGCLVICLTFHITDVQPTETVTIDGWQKRLLIYDFRA